MSAVAPATAPARAGRARAAQPDARPSRPAGEHRTGFRPRRLSAGGLASLLVLGALLGGIVALNVAALRASMQARRLAADAQALKQTNRGLSAEVASLTASLRIDRMARSLGMVQHTPGADAKLRLSPSRHLRAAARTGTGAPAR